MVKRDPSYDPPTGPGKVEGGAPSKADAYAESAQSMLRKLDALSPLPGLPTQAEIRRRRFEEAQAAGLAQAWGTLAVYELLRELRIVAIAIFAVLVTIAAVVILGGMS